MLPQAASSARGQEEGLLPRTLPFFPGSSAKSPGKWEGWRPRKGSHTSSCLCPGYPATAVLHGRLPWGSGTHLMRSRQGP